MENLDNSYACPDHERCLKLLQLVLDNEAPETDRTYYLQHIEKCMPCYRTYNLESEIRKILRSKLEKKRVPTDLAASIRSKIQETA
jgi:anti-sigma factor (TIGR02949 family)